VGGVQLGPLGTAAINRPIVPAPDDYDGEIGGMIGRGNRSTGRKPASSAALLTTNPTCCPDANLGRRGGKLATNRLSTALPRTGLLPYKSFSIHHSQNQRTILRYVTKS
jgi:hypothetical protein